MVVEERQVLAVVVGAVVAGCSVLTGPDLPDGDPAIEGVVVASDVRPPTAPESSTVHVKRANRDMCGIIFVIGEETEIFRRTPVFGLEGSDLDAIRSGDRVKVWSTGPILESCPAQGRADAILIVSG